jgi:hypothetical protein
MKNETPDMGTQAPVPDQAQPPQGNPAGFRSHQPIDAYDFRAKLDTIKDYDAETESMVGKGLSEIEAKRDELLRMFFSRLIEAGVDPSDPKAVAEYMVMLERDDPDMYRMMSEAFVRAQPPSESTQSPAGMGVPQDTGAGPLPQQGMAPMGAPGGGQPM